MTYQDHARLEGIRLRFYYLSVIEHNDAEWIIGQLCKCLPLLEAGAKLRTRMGCIPTFSEDQDAIKQYDAALAGTLLDKQKEKD